MGAVPDKRMTSDEFLAWCDEQGEGRCELVDGEVIMMSPEQVEHSETKLEATIALRNALSTSAPQCRAYVDGPGVRINEQTVREPDLLVQCSPVDRKSLTLDKPVNVVEVVSPSSARSDAVTKFGECFSIPSIRHYLIIDPDGRTIIRHSRETEGGPIFTEIDRDGTITLDPPGITVATQDMLAPPIPDTPQESA